MRALECPITRERFRDPVVAADGATYERAAISGWLETHDTSPLTNMPLAHRQLVPDAAMRARVAAASAAAAAAGGRGVLPALRALRA
jgi:hypothetical protein